MGRIRTFNKVTFTEHYGERHWKNRILKFKPPVSQNCKNKQGIGYRVSLRKDGKHKDFLVARLIATTFLDNLIDTDIIVNHKDGNRLNNKVGNLEWMSRADNIKYGFMNNQYSNTQKQVSLLKDNKMFDFSSMSEASKFLNRNVGYISSCLSRNKMEVTDINGDTYKIILK